MHTRHTPYLMFGFPQFGISSICSTIHNRPTATCLSSPEALCYLVSTHFNTSWVYGSISTALKYRRISGTCFLLWSMPPPNSARHKVHQSESLTTIHISNDAANQLQQHTLSVLDFTHLVTLVCGIGQQKYRLGLGTEKDLISAIAYRLCF